MTQFIGAVDAKMNDILEKDARQKELATRACAALEKTTTYLKQVICNDINACYSLTRN